MAQRDRDEQDRDQPMSDDLRDLGDEEFEEGDEGEELDEDEELEDETKDRR
jgi:hypothetical protein